MKRCLLLLLLVWMGSACSMLHKTTKEEALESIDWSYDEKGLQLSLIADEQLNLEANQPHALYVVLVQVEQSEVLRRLMQNSDGLRQILLSEVEPEGVLSRDSVFLMPGQRRVWVLPRMEGARFLGVVAGYQHLTPSTSARLFQVGVDVSSDNWIRKDYRAKAEAMHIQMSFGVDSIGQVLAEAYEVERHSSAPQSTVLEQRAKEQKDE